MALRTCRNERPNRTDHIRLTSHPDPGAKARFPIHWGARRPPASAGRSSARCRSRQRNVIGSHGGSYALYRALAVSSGALDPIRRPDLTNTHPAATIGPFPQWIEPDKIVSLDPWGHLVAEDFATEIAEGIDIRPTIAVTRARLDLPEMQRRHRRRAARRPTAASCTRTAASSVVKVAIDPVWYLPGIAERFGTTENELRRTLFEQTGGMFPELVTRPDLQVFLPPIGGTTVYLFGDVAKLADPRTTITCRVHDECNGSDVFGSDICTCRPYLIHGIEECARAAQAGGLGIIVYNRKEGRALGEVTKFLVYNARKRQEGGDAGRDLFRAHRMRRRRAGRALPAADARRAALARACARIDRFVSMSDMKYDALVEPGHRDRRARADPRRAGAAGRQVEMEAKKAAGYLHAGAAQARGPERHRRPAARKVLIVPDGQAVTSRRASLLSAAAVRERAHAMLALGATASCRIFASTSARLDAAAELVIDDHARDLSVARRAVPRALAALRDRRRDRWADAGPRRSGAIRAARARAAFDLAIVSVLLDAGAGPHWRYRDAASGADHRPLRRAGVASLDMFATAPSRRDPGDPLRADAAALAELDRGQAAPGLPGRRRQSAGRASRAAPTAAPAWPSRAGCAADFRPQRHPRPGGLFDHLAALARATRCRAASILSRAADAPRPDLAVAADARRRRRSATAGAIRPSDAATRPTASCRSTSCRSGWPIR